MKTIADFPGRAGLELLNLERINPDCWRFRFREPAASVEAECLSEMLFSFHLHSELFHCAPDFSAETRRGRPEAGDRFWLIDSEGVWLLSHLFVNWQEMYRRACPMVIEANESEVSMPSEVGSRIIFGIDAAAGCEAAYLTWGIDVQGQYTPLRRSLVENEEEAMGGRWQCQQCGESFRKLIDVERLVWLKDAPMEQKRVCAACHHRLSHEKKIIREAK